MENEKIDSLVARAVEVDLDGIDFLASFDYDTMKREYNGIGPASLKPELREKLSMYLALFAPAALIHDMRYAASDRTRRNFNFANMEFLENCIKLSNYAYSILNWRRYRAWFVAGLMYKGVKSAFGWDAWCKAYER